MEGAAQRALRRASLAARVEGGDHRRLRAISRLADCLLETRADLDASSLTATIVGHVGDGNFHCLILVDPADAAQVAEAEALHQAMARRAIGMDGTCTGEHGVGLGKRELLVEELGSAISTMAAIKAALDPHDILNPGKILRSRD